MTEQRSLNLHASAISLFGKGMLILGKSGSGKSKLALAMLNNGATLISDDQVILSNQKSGIILSAPESIQGKIEARNIGILEVAHTKAQLCLIVDLDEPELHRLPQKKYTEYFSKKIRTLNCGNLNNLEHSLVHFLKKKI